TPPISTLGIKLFLISKSFCWPLPFFDDAPTRKMLPTRRAKPKRRAHPPLRAATIVVSAMALLAVFCSLVQMDKRFGGEPPAWAEAVDRMVEPLHIVGPYGLFAVMTTRRYELVIQGSKDGVEWRDYEFRYKPGNVARRPLWNIPHQPRLDWQMWFAALDDP